MEQRRNGRKEIKKWRGTKFGKKEVELELYTIFLMQRSRKVGEVNSEVVPPVPKT
jgi:hypothetical protein